MARKRRDNTTADQIQVGDTIEPNNNGIRATVTRRDTSTNCAEPNVALNWQYPNDHSVNANFRGQSSGRLFRPADEITRWS